MEIWQCTDFCINWTLVSLIDEVRRVKTGRAAGHTSSWFGWSYCNIQGMYYMLLIFCRLHHFGSLLSYYHKSFCQVIQFLELQEYSMFTRIVFDTAPTVSTQWNGIMLLKFLDYPLNLMSCFWQGHTLRLLSLPDFLDASIGKILKVGMWMESKKTYRNVFVNPHRN